MEQLHLLVCEYAAVHPDGTFSIIRGGLDRVMAPGLPVVLSVWVYVEVPPGSLELATHAVHAALENENGVSVAEVTGQLNLKIPNQRSRFVMPLTASFQAWGNIKVKVSIGQLTAEREIAVSKVPFEGSLS